jgi:cellulose synthase/poly-beta-1,6-N-acetylglucosamine synthase-like glycosyltransferase
MLSLEAVFKLFGHAAALWLLSDSLLRAALLCLRATTRRARNEATEAEASNGCVVLIAAHEEAGTIGPTVAALKRHLSEWPGSVLWVAADRCADETAVEAAVAGARVAERGEGRLGKGAAIAWWLRNHKEEWQARDAIVILDADSRLAEGSLGVLRRVVGSADKDSVAFQAFVAPDAETDSGRLAGWSEVLMQRIDDEARFRRGWSVPLRGTGMVFRGEILSEIAPRLHTLAEDLELDVLLAAQRKRVVFVPEAVVFDPKPQRPAGASRQRARWLRGQLQVLRHYWREIVSALRQGGLGAWLLLPPLFLRPKVLFMGLRVLMLLASALFPALFWYAVAGLTIDAVYYLAGAAMVDNPRRYLLDLFAAPRYVAIWSYSFGMAMIRRGQRDWLRAGR